MKKFCKDCEHVVKVGTPFVGNLYRCAHKLNVSHNLVTGEIEYLNSCLTLRELESQCGWEGKWFTPKSKGKSDAS